MQDTFKCTPEILCEFFDSLPRNSSVRNFFQEWDNFKSSKSPKKDWEIVAFRHARGTMDVYKLREDGKFRSDETPTGWGFTLEEMIKDEEIIHSVRRLPDASEWQVKEVVEVWEQGRFTIAAFEIHGAEMWVKTDSGTFLLGALQKLPQPILVNLDNFEIFQDCQVTVVFPGFDYGTGLLSGFMPVELDKWAVFRYEDAAEKYVLENKPLLSLNDVKGALFKQLGDTPNTRYLLEPLTALVKQKLNQ